LRLHPEPTQILEGVERDIPYPRVDMVSRARVEARVDHASPARHDLDVELGSAVSYRDREHVIPIAQLVVAATPDGLVVRTRDGANVFDIVAYHERQLATTTIGHFRPLAPTRHGPRVTIDTLVIAREHWTFDTKELAFARATSGSERFLGARRWARELGLPRLLFFRIPEERKPMFLDLDSPVLVNTFAKQVRRAASISISEMLPGLDELWLCDTERRAYTSELRLAAVDPVSWLRRTPTSAPDRPR
jgi:hypothetical protein